MQIRSAQESDYKELMNLYGLFLDNHNRFANLDNDSFIRALNNPNNAVFVAEDNGKLIGFATLSIRDVIRYPNPVGELDELFVLEEYRRQGVAKQLMEEIESAAKKHNCCRMFINSRFESEASHHFYVKIGYTKFGYNFIKNI